MDNTVITETDLAGALPLVARGKVRDLYAIDDQTLLFVATDRISAYDVIMKMYYRSYLLLLASY
jgi:phosphoribosylaminoimidazole-succinocarboxamide synthase